jgi:hypothetical protein
MRKIITSLSMSPPYVPLMPIRPRPTADKRTLAQSRDCR